MYELRTIYEPTKLKRGQIRSCFDFQGILCYHHYIVNLKSLILNLTVRCPICNFHDTKVIDSRMTTDGMSIRRRRECERCSYRFSTTEEAELLDVMVVKRDGRREPYSREKMERGLRKALEKRQYTEVDFKKLVHTIERDIQKKKENELRSSEIGEVVMNRMKTFDKVAYIRFASVYRAFEDVETFKHELDTLLGKKKLKKNKRKKH